jgi:CHAT domain-containing protein
LQNSGIPFIEVDSGLTWVRILRHKGYVSEAREQVDHLVDDVQFYRERLPGVLAAWHWQKREGLYQEYMELALASRAGKGEGEALLLALERIRSLERVVSTGAEAEDGIRNQVARVKAAQPAPGNEPSRQAASVLTAFREGSGWSSGALSSETLTARLEKLGRHDSVLAFYFSDSSVYAVSANRREIRRFQLAGTARIREQIAAVMAAIDNPTGTVPLAGLERLGGLLLEPMARHLGERIFFLSSGPLLGLPLDALRLDGSYLAEVRRVVNLDSLDAMTTPGTELSGGFRDHVFLAGNPRAGRDLFSYGVATSEEIDAVRDAFVGDGLHIVQGVALRGDEFLDERYGNAGLVHLAMPGRIDLVHPERSSLLLSGERESPTTEFLSPARVRGIGLEAQLVVLSGTSFTGRTITDFDSRIGLVSDLQAAGAGLVLATVWPAGDAETARFMSDFYSALEREADVSEALFQTRKARIASKTETNLRSWAGFQLFIR